MGPLHEGGPLVPPLHLLPPLRPFGGLLLLRGEGGPYLPLPNDGSVACSTLMAFPSKDFLFTSLAVSFSFSWAFKHDKSKSS